MATLVLAVLMMSLLGGLHCVGMCGAFLAMAVSPAERLRGGSGGRVPGWMLQGAYHSGRLGTYAALGAMAGAMGAGLNVSTRLLGVQEASMSLAAGVLLVFGGATLLRAIGVAVPRAPMPGALRRWAEAGHRLAWSMDPLPRAWAIGLLTTLLPCGWLYAFVVTAGGTGSALSGVVVMAVFWAGTLPWLATLGMGLSAATGRLRARMPVVTALGLIAAAVLTLVGRVPKVGMGLPGLGAVAANGAGVNASHCGPTVGAAGGAGAAGEVGDGR